MRLKSGTMHVGIDTNDVHLKPYEEDAGAAVHAGRQVPPYQPNVPSTGGGDDGQRATVNETESDESYLGSKLKGNRCLCTWYLSCIKYTLTLTSDPYQKNFLMSCINLNPFMGVSFV